MNDFIKHLDESWDEGIEYFEKTYGRNRWTRLYWAAYKYCINGDCDGGKCFRMRQLAINNLKKGLN